MNEQQNPELNREENLRAENALLKLKLGLEHGMTMSEINPIAPEVENEWLKQVYAFEQQYANAKRIKLYDYIGRPAFKSWNTLERTQVAAELERLLSVLAENNVKLDCLCEYDDAVIYRFLTEELFQHEMDEVRIPGMTCHFTYEEFHPNHDYELRRQVDDFLRAVFQRHWDEELDRIALALKVSFFGETHDRATISAIITAFQDAHEELAIARLKITKVVINTDATLADVAADLLVTGKRQSESVFYEGGCSFHFIREDGFWYIDAFELPGLR